MRHANHRTPAEMHTCGAELDDQDDRLVYDVGDVERVLDISRSSVYTLIRTGQLRSYRVLGSRKVDRQAVLDYLAGAVDTAIAG